MLHPAPTTTFRLPTSDEFPAQIRISAKADQYLDRVADALSINIIGLDRLQGGMLALALAGSSWNHLETVRLTERVAYLEGELDRIHFLLYNKGKTGAHWYAAQTDFLWREAATA